MQELSSSGLRIWESGFGFGPKQQRIRRKTSQVPFPPLEQATSPAAWSDESSLDLAAASAAPFKKVIVAELLSQERLQSGSLNRDHSTKRGV
jgi:hypothetical protein